MNLTPAVIHYALDNLPNEFIPPYIQFGACALMVRWCGLPSNDAEEILFYEMRREYLRQQKKDEDARLKWDMPTRAEKVMDDYRRRFEVTVNYVIDYHRGNNANGGRFRINDPYQGEVVTMDAHKVALYLSQFVPDIMPAHVREARRRLSDRKNSHVRSVRV